MRLHVVVVSHPHFRTLCDSVDDFLKQSEAFDKSTTLVFNKIDRLKDKQWLEGLQENFDHVVCLSAKTGDNIDQLYNEISEMLSSLVVEINVDISIGRMDLVNLAHEEGQVYSVKYYAKTINIRAAVPRHIAGRFYK